MRVDRVIRDILRTVRQIVQALDNNVTVPDNFGPSGAPAGWTILSQGAQKIPKWGPADQLQTSTGTQAVGKDGVDGQPGGPGPTGPPGPSGDTLGHWEPLAFDSEILFDSDGDVVVAWVLA